MATSMLDLYIYTQKETIHTANNLTLLWKSDRKPLTDEEKVKFKCPSCGNLLLRALQTHCGHRVCYECLGADSEQK